MTQSEYRSGRYAAIDIGTVTCRLLIADVNDTGIEVVHRGYGITNLGEGVDASSYLKPEAMERVAKQIRYFLDTVTTFEKAGRQIPVVAMATSAARDATNSEDFINLIASLGVELNVISGVEEASLSFKGVSSDFPDENLFVVDVGGGSTELSLGYSADEPFKSHSYNTGCRRVTERFLHNDPPTDAELSKARAWIIDCIKSYFELQENDFSIDRMIAVAGTATSIVSIHKHMEVYDSSLVHKTVVSRGVLNEVYDNLRSLTLDERKQVIGLDPGRAGVIVAGLLILDTVMELSAKTDLTVSESDILQGIILDTAAK